MYRTLVVLALLAPGAPSVIAAQTPAAAPDPANPAAAVPGIQYESAFAGYQPFREEKLQDWRALNDEVGRAGGHIGIFGGAGGHGAAKSAPASGKPAAAATPAAAEAGKTPARGAPQAPAAGGHKH